MSRFRLYRKRGMSSGRPEDAEFFDELHLPSLMDANVGYDTFLLPKTQDSKIFLYKIKEVSEDGVKRRAFYVKTRKKLPKRFLVVKVGIGNHITGYGYVPIPGAEGGLARIEGRGAVFIVP